MASQQDLLERARQVQLGNYRPAPFVLTKGRGCRVWDVEGKEYLDLSGGIAVLSVGHAHPDLAMAIGEQAARLMHTSNLFHNDRAIELAAALVERTGFRRVYFANSGTEANEAMLKIARRYHFDRGDKERTEFVAAENSFHGRTFGALSVTGQPKYHVGMEPLVPGVHFVPYNDLSAMDAAIGPKTAAVIVESVQAEGGIIVGENAYLQGLRKLCDERGALLLFDEVQTGFGRTGKFLGREWSGVVPDACSLAKGIAGGFPLGAMLVTEKLEAGLPPGSHASTFGGNPLACAASLAVLAIFDRERLLENTLSVGEHLGNALKALEADPSIPAALESRGTGLLRGIRLAAAYDPPATLAKLREAGLLVSIAGGDVLRVSPPLNVSKDEVDRGMRILESVLRDAPKKS